MRVRAVRAGPALGALAAAGVAAGAAWWVASGAPDATPEPRARMTVAEVLGEVDESAFARADAPRELAFPGDHGPHPRYRSEWWYVTGNLAAEDAREFGFQLTLFRFALTPQRPASPSRWATNQVYMAHFAVTDVAGGAHHAAERFSRGAVGLAGAQAAPFRAWLHDWRMRGTRWMFPLALRAMVEDDPEFAVDLVLEGGKPTVYQGEQGWSRKSAEPGNASYYYSRTRMPARGRVRVGGVRRAVSGNAWLDREWSTSALAEDQAGWDWFALQLEDGRDLMYYRLRRRDGSADPFSAGTVVGPEGGTRRLGWRDVRVEVLGHWTSPRDGTRYPARWRLQVPSAGIDVEVIPKVADQEMNLSVRYWEGTVRARRWGGERPIGHGYVELTGY